MKPTQIGRPSSSLPPWAEGSPLRSVTFFEIGKLRWLFLLSLLGTLMVSPAPVWCEESEEQANTIQFADVDGSAEATDPPAARSDFKPLDEIRIEPLAPDGMLPPDLSQNLFAPADQIPLAGMSDRGWSGSVLAWAASELVHQPLYFDDVPLERYGQTVCPALQPAISGARFYATFPVMPYKLLVDHPYAIITTLGKYRPGSPTPCLHQSLPCPCRP